MSGGSMNYLSYKLEDAEFYENTPERRAFRKHLNLVAAALHEIEWVDSGDTEPGKADKQAIMKCISKQDILSHLQAEAKELVQQLKEYTR